MGNWQDKVQICPHLFVGKKGYDNATVRISNSKELLSLFEHIIEDGDEQK